MKKWIFNISCILLGIIIGRFIGNKIFEKGYKQGFSDYNEHFKGQIDSVQKMADTALYYKNLYKSKIQNEL